jgi:hypothetical protein
VADRPHRLPISSKSRRTRGTPRNPTKISPPRNAKISPIQPSFERPNGRLAPPKNNYESREGGDIHRAPPPGPVKTTRTRLFSAEGRDARVCAAVMPPRFTGAGAWLSNRVGSRRVAFAVRPSRLACRLAPQDEEPCCWLPRPQAPSRGGPRRTHGGSAGPIAWTSTARPSRRPRSWPWRATPDACGAAGSSP